MKLLENYVKKVKIKMSNIKGILLDFDGTVVDSEQSRYKSSKKILEKYGFNLTKEMWEEKYKSLSSKQLFEDVINNLQLNVTYEKLYNQAKKLRREIEEKEGVEIIEGFLDFYNQCRELNLKCIVCSGGTTEHVQRIINQCKLDEIGLQGFGREKYELRKPHPDAWIEGLKELGLNKNEVLLFDDAKTGIEAGLKAGIEKCCTINYDEKDFENFNEIEIEIGIKMWKKFNNWKEIDIKELIKIESKR